MSTTFRPKLSVSSNIEGKSVSRNSSVWELLLWAPGLPSTKIVAVRSKPQLGKRPEVPGSGTDGRVLAVPKPFEITLTFRDFTNAQLVFETINVRFLIFILKFIRWYGSFSVACRGNWLLVDNMNARFERYWIQRQVFTHCRRDYSGRVSFCCAVSAIKYSERL